jgi:DedD protein
MDEQLKQRLIGATIIVALSVIFVPMLFEDRNPPAGSGVEDIPALPEAIEEKTIELPKTAADVAQQEKKEEKPAEAETGYRVIPLNDTAPKPAKASKSAKAPKSAKTAEPAEAIASPPEQAEAEAPMDEDFAAEDQDEPPEKPGATVSKVSPAKPAKAAAKQVETQEPEEAEINEKPPAVTEKRKASAAPKSRSAPAKPAEPVAKKPEKSKSADIKFEELPKPIEPTAAKSASAKRVPAPEKSNAVESSPSLKPASAKPSTAARTPPAETAQKPAGATAAWMVQAGSFSEEANARALADKLRKRNLAAVVDIVPVGAGTMYRVRVGPELNRTRAEQIQKQIENAAGIKGIILPRK